jgi:1-acyl-sn-glycerol-3-phosphate acyltransferase
MGTSALGRHRGRRDNSTMTDATAAAVPGIPQGGGPAPSRAWGPFRHLAGRLAREHASETIQRDPRYIEHQIARIRAYTSYFSPEVRGIEHLPAEGPALVVGNHNAVVYMPDTWVTALAIVDRRGTEHPAYTLTYDLLFAFPVVGPFLRRIGAIPAGRSDAEDALADGALVLDYPGGDWEACRPWTERNRIDFGGRTGFVRLALRTGVPLVPVVSHGSHDSVVVLARGDRIARMLGLGTMHIKVFPILLGPLGVTTALLPPPPLPSSVTVEFLPPIVWDGLGPEAADDPETVARCAAEVTAVMQAALDRLRVERAHPVLRGFAGLATRAVRL